MGRSFKVVTFPPAVCCMDGQSVVNDLCSSFTAFQPVLHRAVEIVIILRHDYVMYVTVQYMKYLCILDH